jgi:hypothetical protein
MVASSATFDKRKWPQVTAIGITVGHPADPSGMSGGGEVA